MLRIAGVLIGSILVTSVFAADNDSLAVFGVTLRAPPSMPECATELSASGLSRHKIQTYVITDPKNGQCFERNQQYIGTGAPMADETISIKFSFEFWPELSKYSKVAARVVDGNIERLWFWTNGIASQANDIAALKRKFGTPQTESSSTVQTKIGATFQSTSALWNLSNGITVLYTSADGSIDSGIVVVQTAKGEEAYRKAIEAIGGPKTQL